MLVVFQVLSGASYVLGFVIMGEAIPWKHLLIMTGTQFLLLLEVGTICFAVSAFSRKNVMGIGLGLVFLFFVADMMCRLVPDLENLKYLVPFSYCNATDIFTDTDISVISLLIGIGITILSYVLAHVKYLKKDFSA